MLGKHVAASATLAVLVPVLAACGGTSPSKKDAPSAAGSGSAKGASGDSALCAKLTRGGAGPADAFMEIQLYSAKEAHKEALAQSTLMDGATPPPAIAEDWQTWQSLLRATAKASASGHLASLTKKYDHAQHAQKRLTDYAFAHCS